MERYPQLPALKSTHQSVTSEPIYIDIEEDFVAKYLPSKPAANFFP